jgi:hypothetical protein
VSSTSSKTGAAYDHGCRQPVAPALDRGHDDLEVRAENPADYIQIINKLATFLGRSPDTATFEDLRRFQLHVVASGVGTAAINRHVSALRFFFRVTLKRYAIVEPAQARHLLATGRFVGGMAGPTGLFGRDLICQGVLTPPSIAPSPSARRS